MPSMMNTAVGVTVAGGPSYSVVHSLLAGGYSVLEVQADAGDSASFPFQPGTVDGIGLMLITSSRYDPDDLTYELAGETIALDGPQLFTGAGMLSRFGADPDTITVNNDLTEPVRVTVLVGRTTP